MADPIAATLVDISRDVRLAAALGLSQPAADIIEALRERLRSYITMLAVPAEEYGRSRSGEWYGSHILDCIANARTAATGNIPPDMTPDEELLLLAEFTKTLLLYAGRSKQGT
ncbi:hypothetical protein [Streptomyces sp. NPDC047315]|uniref:hypothetical protein n=1 Tax=Streptomyces sp. NPDC047315 TaxID=3155142 RepID=UPI0033FF710C